MPVNKADEYRHNNPDRAFVDSGFVRGGRRVVADRAALYALASKADQLKEGVTIVRILSDADNSNAPTEVLLIDDSQIGSAAGWELYATGGGGTPVDPGADFVLYTGTGQGTDGAMTQKATTDALGGKVNEGDARLSDARTPTAHTHPASEVTGLAAVATSGDYNSLLNKPTIPQAPDLSGYVTTQQLADNSTADRARANHTGTQSVNTITGLATVATTGNYSDLTGKPTIPAALDAIPRAGTDSAAPITGFLEINQGTGIGWTGTYSGVPVTATIIASSGVTGPRLTFGSFSDVYLQPSRTALIGTAYGGAFYFFDASVDPIGIQASRPVWARYSLTFEKQAITAAGVDGGRFLISKDYLEERLNEVATGGSGGVTKAYVDAADTALQNSLNNKTNNATTAALSGRVTALEQPLLSSELLDTKQDWVGMTPRAALLRLINQGSTTPPTGSTFLLEVNDTTDHALYTLQNGANPANIRWQFTPDGATPTPGFQLGVDDANDNALYTLQNGAQASSIRWQFTPDGENSTALSVAEPGLAEDGLFE